MKAISRVVMVLLIISEVIHTYPQKLLINYGVKNVEKVDIVDKSVEKDYGYLKIDVKIPQIVGMTNKEGENKINKEINLWAKNWVEDAEENIKDIFGKNPEFIPNQPYELSNKYEISYKSDKIVSILMEYYQYLGGAHGITLRKSYNIDLETGKDLKLQDLFRENVPYNNKICEEIKKDIKENPNNYFVTGENVQCSDLYYLTDDNIIIYYQIYDIAPYVYGFPEFKIPYNTFEKGDFKYR